MEEEISIVKCFLCFREFDEYKSQVKFRTKKCCVCHNPICKTCFFNKDNKQNVLVVLMEIL